MTMNTVRWPLLTAAFILFSGLSTHNLRADDLSPQVSAPPTVDHRVRDERGNVDYTVELYPEIPSSFAKELNHPSHFASFHKPQVVNAVDHFETSYGIQAHEMTSWAAPTFTAFLSDDQLKQLQADPRVKSIDPNTAVVYSIANLPDTNAVWTNTISTEVAGWGKIALNPSTVASDGSSTVYVVDSGVAPHEDLNVVEYVNPHLTSSNDCGSRFAVPCTAAIMQNVVGCYVHATAVAGVIGAIAGNGKGIQGVNPGVKIVSVVAPNNPSSGGCVQSIPLTQAMVNVALDWVVSDMSNHPSTNKSVVNLSLNPSDGVGLSEYSQIARHALFVQSAGNDYQDACLHAYPYSSSNAVTNDDIVVVGALNNHGQAVTKLSQFTGADGGNFGFWRQDTQFAYDVGSNYGTCVDLWAPGDGIYTTLPNPGTTSNQVGSPPGGAYTTYGFGSGTSFSAPHISGLASRLIEQQHITSGSVEQALRATAYSLGSTDKCNGGCSIAIKMPSLHQLPAGSANKPYGELSFSAYDASGNHKNYVNGFPYLPPAMGSHNYTGNVPPAISAYSEHWQFTSTGSGAYGCSATRNSTAFPLVTMFNNVQTVPLTVETWTAGASWGVSPDCFEDVMVVAAH